MRRELRLILKHLRSVLDPRETLVIVGGETGGRWLAGSDRQLRALLLSPFTGQTLTTLLCPENAPDLLALTASADRRRSGCTWSCRLTSPASTSRCHRMPSHDALHPPGSP
jgi:hypothetical protein